MVRFTLPRDLYHGKGALEALKTLKGKKAIICVGGGSMKRFGFLQRAEDYLKEDVIGNHPPCGRNDFHSRTLFQHKLADYGFHIPRYAHSILHQLPKFYLRF